MDSMHGLQGKVAHFVDLVTCSEIFVWRKVLKYRVP